MQQLWRSLKAVAKAPVGLLRPKTRRLSLCDFPRLKREYSGLGLSIVDPRAWERAFKRFILAQPNDYEVATDFYKYPPTAIRELSFDPAKPIVIVVEKNETVRIKKFLEHYRSLGATQFAVVDNGSDDDTLAYLLAQSDTAIYSAAAPYTTPRREAWINRIIAHYGFDRWYLIADADELCVYDGVERHGLDDLLAYMAKRGIKRVRGMLLDMYGSTLFGGNANSDNPYEEYRYFDTKGYSFKPETCSEAVRGGFRNRVFSTDAFLTKYPLVYFRRGNIQGKSHFLFPYLGNLNKPCYIALLHYKFLCGDMEKYRAIAENESFYNGSAQYKQYVKVIDAMGTEALLCNEQSHVYSSSEDLAFVPYLSKLDWKGR